MKISERAFIDAANELGIEVPMLKALAEVESKNAGFLSNGEPIILFEAHKFSQFTNGKYDKTHPQISSPLWNRHLYKGGTWEHRRLQEAVKLNRTAALKSASWGAFQIMGFNWQMAGYRSLQAFINDAYAGIDGHFRMLIGFVKGAKLTTALRKKNFERIAKVYNGKGYKANRYDTRLEQAYWRHANDA